MTDLLKIALIAAGFVVLVNIASRFHHPAQARSPSQPQGHAATKTSASESRAPIIPELREAVNLIVQGEFKKAAERLREAENYYREHYRSRYFRVYLPAFTTAEVYLEHAWEEPEKAVWAYDTLQAVFPGLSPLSPDFLLQKVQQIERVQEINRRILAAEEFAESVLGLEPEIQPTLEGVSEAWELANSLDDSLEVIRLNLESLDSLLAEAPDSVKPRIERVIEKLKKAETVLPKLKKQLNRKLRKYIRPKYWNDIKQRRVKLGMNRYEVMCSWGEPDDINRSVSVYGGVHEQWVYGDPLEGATYLYFDNGILESWQEW